MHAAGIRSPTLPVWSLFSVPSTKRIVVVGAGPSGLLSALYLARRGYNVEVHERGPAPGVTGCPRPHNHAIILSSRALLAFRELKLQTSYYGPEAPKHLGTWQVVSGVLEAAHPEDENLRTVIADRRGEL